MSDVFQLLSDPSRRHLLDALRNGERSVNDLVRSTAMSQPAVSKQLRRLRESGAVRLRTHGRQHLYSIRGEPLREASEWLGFYEKFWREGLERMDEILGPDPSSSRKGRR